MCGISLFFGIHIETFPNFKKDFLFPLSLSLFSVLFYKVITKKKRQTKGTNASSRKNPTARRYLLAHGAGTTLAGIGLGGLGLGDTLGKDLSVLVLKRVVLVAVEDCTHSELRKKLTASSLTFSAWRRLRAARWRLCWRRWGVTSLWILGALV